MNQRDAAVADAGPLIHLDELSRLGILKCYRRIRVPGTVFKEADRHRPGWLDRCPGNIERVEVSAQDIQAFMSDFSGRLDPGEIETLAFWRKTRSSSILCDDFAAREAARAIGAPVIGTVGLLVKAAHLGSINPAEAVALIRSIPEKTTLHIRRVLMEEAAADVARKFRLDT